MDKTAARLLVMTLIILGIAYLMTNTKGVKRALSAKPGEMKTSFEMIEEFADGKDLSDISVYKEGATENASEQQ